MAQENAFGAPQAGPNSDPTFSFSVGAPPTLQLPQQASVSAGIRGGDTVNPGGTQGQLSSDTPKDATTDILLKVGQSLLAPKLKELKINAYITGMQRAAQGEAVTDIVKEQPWYTKIFGDTDVVEGARAYTGHIAAQNTVTALDERMRDLRKLPPAEATAAMTQAVKDGLTGDPGTDISIMSTLTQQLPLLMRRQAKEHYAYTQERAAGAQSAAFNAGAGGLQRALADPTSTAEDKAQARALFRSSVQPVPGQDTEGWLGMQAKLLSEAALGGKFHVVHTILGDDGENPGLLQAFSVEQRKSIQSALDTGEALAKSKYSLAYGDKLAALYADAKRGVEGDSASLTGKAVDDFNKQYSQATGSIAGLISPAERLGLVSGKALQVFDARVANAEAARKEYDTAQRQAAASRLDNAKEAAKLDTERRMKAELHAAAAGGYLGQIVNNPGYSKMVFDTIVPMYQSLPPEQQDRMLAANTANNYTIGAIRDALDGGLKADLASGELTPEVQARIAAYERLYAKNPATASDYYPSHDTKLAGYLTDISQGMTKQGAFNKRFLGTSQESSLNAKDMVKAVEAITSDYNSWLPGWAGGQKMAPGQARRAAIELGGSISMWQGSLGDIQKATAMALHTAKNHTGQGVELVGGYTVTYGKGAKSIQNYLAYTPGPNGEDPIPQDKLHSVVSDAIETELYGSGEKVGILRAKTSDIFVNRIDVKGGPPLLELHAIIDGVPKRGLVSVGSMYKPRRKDVTRGADVVFAEPGQQLTE